VFMTVVGTALQYVLGLALALLVLQIRWGQVAFRVLFLLPVMISPVAVGYVIGRMLFSETQGPVNDLLVRLGLSSVPWLSDPGMAPWTIILTDTWQWTSLMFILLLAGLQAIPNDVYEAAKVDGAKAWQVFFHITFPLLAPVTVTAILIRSLELFKLVDIVRVMTGGGPGNATETATLVVYKLALENGDVAYGSTVGFALLITMIIFSLIYLAVTRSFVRRAT
jgi:multiple sugar transport system permease protein